jgi:hypothetical protein
MLWYPILNAQQTGQLQTAQPFDSIVSVSERSDEVGFVLLSFVLITKTQIWSDAEKEKL